MGPHTTDAYRDVETPRTRPGRGPIESGAYPRRTAARFRKRGLERGDRLSTVEMFRALVWSVLAIAHLPPAAVAFGPGLVRRLYGVAPEGSEGLLLQHRGALFVAVAIAAGIAVVDPGTRRAASLVVGVSVVGFLVIYGRGGWPAGPLRSIAWVDVALLIPLVFATHDAWTGGSTPASVDAQLDARGQ